MWNIGRLGIFLALACIINGEVSNSSVKIPLTDDEIVREQWKTIEKSLKSGIGNLMKRVMPTLLRANSETELSPKCTASILKLVSGLKQLKSWAFEMLDAAGKPAGGFLSGTLTTFGSYDECINIEAKDSKKKFFDGQYCMVDFHPPLPPKPIYYTMHYRIQALKNLSAPDEMSALLYDRIHFFYFLTYRLGFCMPSTCTKTDVSNMFEFFLKDIPLSVELVGCQTKPDGIQIDTKQMITIIAFVVVVLLVVCGTIYDVYHTFAQENKSKIGKPVPPGKCQKSVLAFSVFRSIRSACSSSTTLEGAAVVHGIRSISIFWMFSCHIFLQSRYQMLSLLMNAVNFSKSALFQIIVSSLAQDSILFTTGFILAYTLTGERRHVTFWHFIGKFLQVLWRYTPPYLAVIGITILLPLTGSGPMWDENLNPVVENCRKNWWTNIVYLNNFLIRTEERCIRNTWLISTEVQLILLGLLVLALMRYSRAGVALSMLLIACSIVVVGLFTAWTGSPPTVLFTQADPEQRNMFEDFLFDKPYPYVAVFFIGLTLGFALAKKPVVTIKPRAIIIGWIFALLFISIDVFGLIYWNGREYVDPTITILFAAFHRSMWSLAMAWIVFLSVTGKGGVVAEFLSSSIFIVFSKLTFLSYIIHPLVQTIFSAHLRERVQATTFMGFVMFFALCGFTYLTAFVVSIFIEKPLQQLEKNLFSSKCSISTERFENGHTLPVKNEKLRVIKAHEAENHM